MAGLPYVEAVQRFNALVSVSQFHNSPFDPTLVYPKTVLGYLCTLAGFPPAFDNCVSDGRHLSDAGSGLLINLSFPRFPKTPTLPIINSF